MVLTLITTAIALSAAGVAISAASAAVSFAQAAKQKKAAAEADAAAEKSLADAKSYLDKNHYDALSINKDVYTQAWDSLVSMGDASVMAAAEQSGGRGVEAAAGQVLAASNEQGQTIRNAENQDLRAIEQQKLAEESRLDTAKSNLDLQAVKGAQQASHDYNLAATQSTAQGIQGLANTAQQALSAIPLYSKTAQAKGANSLIDSATKSGWSSEQMMAHINEQAIANPSLAGFKMDNASQLKDVLTRMPKIYQDQFKTAFSTTPIGLGNINGLQTNLPNN